MIVTLTPNPSIDRTLTVSRYVPGEVNRAAPARLEPSGKGVNVSLALRAQGHATRPVLPLGGEDGGALARMLRSTGMEFTGVPIEGSVRSNVSVIEDDGTVTKINEPGPCLSSAETEALLQATVTEAERADWLLVGGSLPHGAPADSYARLIDAAHAAGVRARIAVDTSGPALAGVLGRGPDLVKPNVHELAEAAGMPVTTLGEALEAARRLRAAGAQAVLASLGSDGALLVEGDGAVHAEARVARPQNTVGAGDALLAGFLAFGGTGSRALREALRWASGAIQQSGTLLGPEIDDSGFELRVHDRVEHGRRLLLD